MSGVNGTSPTPPGPRVRALVTAVVGLLALTTTAAVSIVADRAIHGRGAARGDEEHGEHGEHEKGHGDHDDHEKPEKRAKGHGDHEEREKKGHGEETHDDHAGEKHGDAGDRVSHGEHGAVTLTAAQRGHAGIELLDAGPGKVDEIMELPGEVAFDADRVAHVTPRAEGTVREVKADLGDEVKKGDVLAILESREVAAMQQESMAAHARRELAEASFRRIEPLYKDGISSEKEYLAAKQALAEAKIDEASAGQKLAAGAGPRATGTGLALVAPLDGVVVEKHVTIGEVLGPNTQAFVVADLSRLWIWTTAHARELGRVRKGQRAYVRADGIEAPLLGKVDYVQAMLGEKTRTARARIVVDAPPEGWRPGMFVGTELVVAEVEAPVVAREDAIQRLGEHAVIFVEEKGRFVARNVELGRAGRDADGRLVRAIDAGLHQGERYVAKNAFILKAELGKGSATHEH